MEIEEIKAVSNEALSKTRRRKTYANALNKSLEIFVSHSEDSFDDVLSNGLHFVANAVGLDRIIVFRVWDTENIAAGEIYRWDKSLGGTAPIDDALRSLPVTPTIKGWLSAMKDETCISLRRSEFKEGEASFLSPREVKSILIVPVFTERKMWGVVTFHDNSNERDFDEDSKGLLRSVARLCASALIREEKSGRAVQAAEALGQREKMIRAINEAAIMFLSHYRDTFEDMMAAGTEIIAEAMDLDRISVWRNFPKGDGVRTSQIYRWDKDQGGSTVLTKEFEDFDAARFLPRWIELMAGGETINSPIGLLPEAKKLRPYGVVSIYAAPMFIDDGFWGFAVFEDRRAERFFDDNSADVMRSAAFLCANTIIMHEKTQKEAMAADALRRRGRMADALNETAVIFLSQRKDTFDEMMTAGIWRIAEVLDLDRIGVYRNFRRGGLRASQIYRWDRKSGGTTGLTQELTNILYSEVVPRWEGHLGKGKIINSPVKFLPEAALLKSYGVVSVFVAPLFIHNAFWGFVMMEDRSEERFFDDDSVDVMRSAAFLCVNNVILYEQRQNEKKASDALKWREKTLGALNDMSAALLSREDETFDDAMNRGIRPISDAVGVDRVAVYRLLDRDSKFGQVYLWSGMTLPLEDDLRVLPDIEPVDRLVKILTKGACINANVSEMQEDEAAFLGAHGVKGILLVPIFASGAIWGAITFEDHTNYRSFDEGAVDFLRSAAHLCAGAILRMDMERDIAAKNKLLATLNQMASFLLQSDTDSFGHAMHQCLGLLAATMRVDRACIWKNRVLDGQLCCTLTHEWAEGAEAQLEAQLGAESTIDKSYSESLPGWEQMLAQGKFINGTVRSLPEAWQAQFAPQGILSILIMPVFLQNGFWGFVGFDDCHEERSIMQGDENILRSASHLIANALMHNEGAVQAREADERVRLMLDATPMSCHLWDEDISIVDCNLEAVKLFGLESKEEYIEKYFDLSPKHQPDSALSSEKAVEKVKEAWAAGRTDYEWMHQKFSGELIPTEKTSVKVNIGRGRAGIASYTRDMRAAKEAEAKINEANALNQIMFSAMPLGCILWTEEGIPFDCNDEVLKLFGIPSKHIFLRRFFDLSPEYQPGGSNSTEMIMRLIPYALNHNKVSFEWMHQNLSGEMIPAEVNLIKSRHDDVNIVIGYVRDLREIKEQSAKLDLAEKMAFSDPLTGIHNRRSFMHAAVREFSLARSSVAPIGIIMFDIDFFKQVNDTYGHDCGDEGLKMVAAAAQSVLRESDLLARYGGEEFVILVQNLDLYNLAKLAERILRKIESADFVYEGTKIPMTVSAGVAVRKRQDQTHEQIIKNADTALYQAKENGRNRVEVFSD